MCFVFLFNYYLTYKSVSNYRRAFLVSLYIFCGQQCRYDAWGAGRSSCNVLSQHWTHGRAMRLFSSSAKTHYTRPMYVNQG